MFRRSVTVRNPDTRSDFAGDARFLGIAFAAAFVGVLSTVAAHGLLQLIRLFTNIFFFHSLSVQSNSPANNPLLTACATAYGFTVLLMPRSILTEKIARRGYHIYREYGIDPLERHTVGEVMTREITSIAAESTIGDALETHFGAGQIHRAFPVVRNGAYLGMVDRDILMKHAAACRSMSLGELFGENLPVMALAEETCRIVATRLAVHRLERLPVVKDASLRELVGPVARSDLIKPSRALFDEEQNFEQFNPWPWK